ncbi:ATP synthase F1 subunit gamma [Candidatus Epulonipiscium fishelsonii]|uniref:ATP synthase F1 subunit gamma n=1 Tax=Candidatus Epulonipiscium fishelsonii TaxID=77094 RepID=A0ACC8XEC7_9FIRM|nr:ATP synthase F1 subunit gamma [Epulopiscium sp. SCG-B11WGA-EpuloA1]ONI43940.1 ATP synthase F1 subunit gamma [Epulopiscium sp. SCG-B05WGA-EpuloA1]
MASLQDIKSRSKSINSTKQITNAMKLVATAKLTKSKDLALKSRPFFNKMQETIHSIASNAGPINMPLLKANASPTKVYIVLAGDRGLAGGYNANVCKLVMRNITNKDEAKIITVGKKTLDQFKTKGYNVIHSVTGISETPTYKDAKLIADYVIDIFGKGDIGEVYLAYTSFVSTIQQEPTMIRLLPLDINQVDKVESTEPKDLLLYEPSAEDVLGYVIPRYIADVTFGGLVEAGASEQGARMTAMDSATENAEEMIEKLDIEYNRARQAAITQELTEIVAGAEAL